MKKDRSKIRLLCNLIIGGIVFIGGIASIALGYRKTPAEQRAIFESFVCKPLPASVEVVDYGQLVGIAGSISVYDLRLDDQAIKAILSIRNYSTSPDLAADQFVMRILLEKYGEFTLPDLTEFQYFEANNKTHTIRFLVKVPQAYCVISR